MHLRKIIWVILAVLVVSCGHKTNDDQISVKVKKVLQVNNYTYLLVEGKKGDLWIAAPSMEASPGEKYTYQGGMIMKDFYSKELDRSFDEVLFVEGLVLLDDAGMLVPQQETTPGSRTKAEKADVMIGHAEGSTSIADLYENPRAFEGKMVRVTGEVTKYNPAIMDRNWVHLQDGTEYKGKFDLTATSDETFQIGDHVTLQGVLALNQDFGYGYMYEILLEKAQTVE